MHYQFKQDLAMAYFDGCSKKTASRLLAREINLTPGLLDALRLTPDAPGQYTLDLTSRSSAWTSAGGPLLLTLTTADGCQHTVRLLKQSDIFGE